MKKIVMTGGGTAGHVTPNIALFPALQKEGYEISYIGSYEGIEKRLIEEQGVPYYGISSGKLRRYFDPKNFSDPFKVLKGYHQSVRLLKKLKPDVVFSKGGFVSVPVVLAASRCHIPAIIHELDLTPGLANRIAIPKATKVLQIVFRDADMTRGVLQTWKRHGIRCKHSAGRNSHIFLKRIFHLHFHMKSPSVFLIILLITQKRSMLIATIRLSLDKMPAVVYDTDS